jgi:hypothetical protein
MSERSIYLRDQAAKCREHADTLRDAAQTGRCVHRACRLDRTRRDIAGIFIVARGAVTAHRDGGLFGGGSARSGFLLAQRSFRRSIGNCWFSKECETWRQVL